MSGGQQDLVFGPGDIASKYGVDRNVIDTDPADGGFIHGFTARGEQRGNHGQIGVFGSDYSSARASGAFGSTAA